MTALTAADAADLFRAPPHRHLDVGAGEVALRTVGSGPDVLFVHGWPVSGATFRLLLPHLVDHLTCHVIDLPSAGSSRFDDATPLSVDQHIATVRRVVDQLELDEVAVVGHDSGGLIARHALAGDPRLRAMGLIDTEQPQGLSFRFKLFLAGRHLPGFGAALGWSVGRPRVRRNALVLGGAFVDDSLLDGEFDEFFLRPLHEDPLRLRAALRVLRTFDERHVRALAGLHERTTVPVQLVWGEQDAFFPLGWAREMATTFPDGRLAVIPGAGLFSHEERPAEVAQALLPVLAGRS
ncbi:MAG: alpha/beta hydrolase [Actinobacteria bacterium]|nr:alpha/beta hydrolase [Actinomycetota bacterium]